MARKYKARVKYDDVRDGLHYPYCRVLRSSLVECDPGYYIRTLRTETGLSYAKIAHDLRADSGMDVSDQAVYAWGRGGEGESVIENWTDVDYAQAAIDMLPGTVEEIEEFLDAQELGPTCRWNGNKCPIARWVAKWTGRTVYAGCSNVYMGENAGEGGMVRYPGPVYQYVAHFDKITL